MNNKTFRILSIDGGGAKGLYASKVLETITTKYGNKRLCDHFDLICGTSTGGLIALALSLGFPPATISEFYYAHGTAIFPKKSWFVRKFGQLYRNLYDSDDLKRVLTEFFGTQRTLAECQSLICIPSYNVSRGQPIVFKRPCQTTQYDRDGGLNVIDVAMATASAPTYFRNHTITANGLLENTICTDGGVWANNPTLCGLHEAWDHYVGDDKPFDSVALLSISTAQKPSGTNLEGGGVKQWKEHLMGTSLSGQSFFADHFLKMLERGSVADVTYRRIIPGALSGEEQTLLEMDAVKPKSLKKLSELGVQSGMTFLTQEKQWISQIFNTKKSYTLN